MKKKYLLNTGTGTLHIEDSCKCVRFGGVIPSHYKVFRTEDEVTVYAKNYKKNCKDCFRDR